MDPLETFIEFSQWKGSVDEARERINAAGGDVMIALEMLYADGFGSPQPEQPMPQQQQPRQQPRQPKPDRARPQSLIEEINKEYSRDLVKYPVARIPPLPLFYMVSIPVISSVVSKLTSIVSDSIGYKTPSSEDLKAVYVKSAERYFDNIVSPALPGVEGLSKLRAVPYNDALERTKSHLNYLLVVITNETTDCTPFFNVLYQSGVLTLSECNVWFSSVLSSEGLGVAESLGFSKLPGVALVAPSPKTAQSSIIVMGRLLKFDGLRSPAEFMASIRAAIADHEPKLVSLRLERQQFDVDRQIREEQDHAYLRSLDADRQRMEHDRAEKSKAEKRETLQKAWRASVFHRAKRLQEPTTTPSTSMKLARISVRLPDGKRINLSVKADAKLDDIYCLVYAHLNEDEGMTVSDTDLEEFEPEYGFGLVSPVSRRTLDHDSTIVRDVDALWPSGVLMVDMD